MTRSTATEAGVANSAPTASIGSERLLSIADVCAMTGFCPVTASKFMKESGRSLTLHRRVFILESSFYSYLHELEEANDGE
ncbi:hypothetical protein DW878_05070 [Olsenella sp. AM39-30AC]|uniref:hypothetical protein n=1 Tax=Olsenella sp. AM39-30AC TaxID=2292360 RepID=UPI000E46AF16|nr:hypothetical protein [Olsenella sp. AM39-30AC]RHB55754.1 hypothetical protein DW878_05070 [Olsenella sp. AM39-30AC]